MCNQLISKPWPLGERQNLKLCLRLREELIVRDVEQGLATFANRYSLNLPLHAEGKVRVIGMYHPALAKPVQNYICCRHGATVLFTGCNEAGKSTLMKTLVGVVLLHQIGSFVPADYAKLPLFDKVMCRVKSFDRLDDGLSSFMVQAKDVATYIAESTPKSLVAIDEIFRTTNADSALVLAQTVFSKTQGTLLVATHDKRLCDEDGVVNMHMDAGYKLKEGRAKRENTFEVAEKYGMPAEIVQRAREMWSQA